MRWSQNLILGMEPKFHADWSKNRRARGLCKYCVNNTILFFEISRFLDVANTSSTPHLINMCSITCTELWDIYVNQGGDYKNAIHWHCKCTQGQSTMGKKKGKRRKGQSSINHFSRCFFCQQTRSAILHDKKLTLSPRVHIEGLIPI